MHPHYEHNQLDACLWQSFSLTNVNAPRIHIYFNTIAVGGWWKNKYFDGDFLVLFPFFSHSTFSLTIRPLLPRFAMLIVDVKVYHWRFSMRDFWNLTEDAIISPQTLCEILLVAYIPSSQHHTSDGPSGGAKLRLGRWENRKSPSRATL